MTYYFQNLIFDGDSFSITLKDESGSSQVIEFKFVRSVLFYKEVDFFDEISKYIKKSDQFAILKNQNVFQLDGGTIMGAELYERYSSESPMIFGVWTPDECFEILCFESPSISYT